MFILYRIQYTVYHTCIAVVCVVDMGWDSRMDNRAQYAVYHTCIAVVIVVDKGWDSRMDNRRRYTHCSR